MSRGLLIGHLIVAFRVVLWPVQSTWQTAQREPDSGTRPRNTATLAISRGTSWVVGKRVSSGLRNHASDFGELCVGLRDGNASQLYRLR